MCTISSTGSFQLMHSGWNGKESITRSIAGRSKEIALINCITNSQDASVKVVKVNFIKLNYLADR